MTEAALSHRRLPSPTGLVAGALVVLGVLLWMLVNKGLLFIAGLGAFGPGILRELGVLRDQDELQRAAAHRAGYHAYLTGGLAVVLLASAFGWREEPIADAAEWFRLILIVLWLSWLFSALSAYWGARKMTRRVLVAFGSFWGLFVLAAVFGGLFGGSEPTGGIVGMLVGLAAGTMFVGPFFLLAWTAERWPRRTGVGLLVVAVFFFVILSPRNNLAWSVVLFRSASLLVPLIGCGIALLRERAEPEELADLA